MAEPLTAGITRDRAFELLNEHNKDPFHITHGETVEGTMRYFAREFDPENEEFWGIVGLLHDLDWEEHEDDPINHTIYAAEILEGEGASPELIRAIQTHTSDFNTSLPKPELQMEKILFACDELTGLIGAAVIIIVYTFLGGFNAVCWTDFFQGLLMLAALMIAPIIAVITMQGAGFIAPDVVIPDNYYNALISGSFDKTSVINIISGLAWGLGYMGMPHILIRYISIKSEKEMKKSRIVGTCWTGIILIMASVVGMVGLQYLGGGLTDNSQVFIRLVRGVFPALVAGILLSAILAASMSTADSQLLASSSAFASDVYKPIFRKKASDNEMLWAGRIVVIIISVVALAIAMNPDCEGIMALVSNAWGAFGSAFGPVIVLSLYWKRLNYNGALASIIVGFAVDMLWYKFLATPTGLYEIVPGFAAAFITAIVVSLLTKKPDDKVVEIFEKAKLPTE